MRLHDYQRRSVRRIKAAFRAGHRRVLFTLPTGTGKTVVATDLISEWVDLGVRVLFLAHRTEIVNQTVATLERYGVSPEWIGVTQKKHPRENFSLPVQVASVQTLARRSRKPKAHVIVIDEAHHAVSDSYRSVVEAYPNAMVLGLTATPFLANGGGLDADFDELIVGAKPSELVAAGRMSKARIWSIPEAERDTLQKQLRKVGTGTTGDYSIVGSGRVMNKAKLVGDIVEHWQRLGKGRPTVVYATTVPHGKRVLAAFKKARVKAEMVDASTPDGVRSAMLDRLASGVTQVVVNCLVLTEGWDSPKVKCIILARPTRSLVLYLQILGRGLRPGVDCIVLDHTGSALRGGFGFPHFDRDMSLGGSLIGAKGDAPCKRCTICGELAPTGASECPNGHPFEIKREPAAEDGELRELDPVVIQQKLTQFRERAARAGLGVALTERLFKAGNDALS